MPEDATAEGQEFGSLAWVQSFIDQYGVAPIAGGETAPGEGGGEQPTGQGAPAPSGQSTAPAKSDDGGFNWGLFPDVPEDQRPELEPHLKNVQGHVTKLEQQYAPFKEALESGVSPEEVQGLLQFNQAFAQSPLDAWLDLGQRMVAEGYIQDTLDWDSVRAIATGEDEGDEGEDESDVEEDDIPPWGQKLLQQFEGMTEAQKREAAAQRKAQQDKLVQKGIEKLRSELKGAGLPDVGEELLLSAIIANKGDLGAASKQLTTLAGVSGNGSAENVNPEQGELTMPHGAPPTDKPKKRPNNAWGKARQGASQMLARNERASAQ